MKRNRDGFTLAELLIVVAILGILVAVSIAIFTGKLQEAKETVCKNERTTMRHVTVIAAMNDEKDWTGIRDMQQVGQYLLDHHYIEELFVCQSGGTIYVSDSHASGLHFNCTFHTDNIDPNEGILSDDMVNGLAEALKSYIDVNENIFDNTNIIKGFLNSTQGSGAIKTANVKTILTDEVIDKIVATLVDKGWTNTNDSLKNSIVKITEKPKYVVPYVAYSVKPKEVLTYATDNYTNFEKQGHSTTNLVNYKGKWYFAAVPRNNKTESVTATYLIDFGKCITTEAIEDILNNNPPDGTVWIPL